MAIRKNKPPVRDGITYRAGAGTALHDGEKNDQELRPMDQLATGGRVMRKKEHEEHDKDERKERAAGGRTKDDGDEGSGSPEFFAGAESPTAKAMHGEKEAAKGGRIKRKARKRGGAMVEGKAAHRRLDRASGGRARMRRASGGMTGADVRPLTEANKLTPPKGDKRTPQDNSEDD